MQTRHLTIAVAIVLSAAASAHAATTADTGASTDAALSAQTLDTVSVIGQGETRQVQRITAVDKQVLPPGTSGQKILDRLPGVSVQSNDAFGANEESQTISLRGFDKSRLGSARYHARLLRDLKLDGTVLTVVTDDSSYLIHAVPAEQQGAVQALIDQVNALR